MLLVFLSGIWLLGAGGVLLAAPWPAAPLIALLLVVPPLQAARRHALLAHWDSITSVFLRADGRVEATARGGYAVDATLSGESVVTAWLVVLRLVPASARGWDKGWKTRTVLILPDSLDDRSFRRLKVWARWRGGHRV